MTTIPAMTDPLGKHWEQPDRSEIVIDERYAVMTVESFSKLKKYNHSDPTGIYAGKMWAKELVDGCFILKFVTDLNLPTNQNGWRFFDIHSREILLLQ
jgi:hypothetical protein